MLPYSQASIVCIPEMDQHLVLYTACKVANALRSWSPWMPRLNQSRRLPQVPSSMDPFQVVCGQSSTSLVGCAAASVNSQGRCKSQSGSRHLCLYSMRNRASNPLLAFSHCSPPLKCCTPQLPQRAPFPYFPFVSCWHAKSGWQFLDEDGRGGSREGVVNGGVRPTLARKHG